MRTYEQDIEDVRLAKAGDAAAMQRLLTDYDRNMRGVAKKFEHRIDIEDGMQIAALALLDYVMAADDDKARRLRSAVYGITLDALNEHVGDGIGRTSLKNARAAAEAMRPQVEESGERPLSLYEAAERYDVSVSLLANYMGLSEPVSFDGVFGDAYDEDNPFDADLAGGFRDDDAIAPTLDPEFSNRPSAFALEQKCELPTAEGQAASASLDALLRPLSKKQQAVMRLVAEGLSDAAVAERLSISLDAAKKTRQRSIAVLRDAMSPQVALEES